MGEVYRAMDTRLGRDVAIKVLPTTITANRQSMARFAREAQLLASLNHPGDRWNERFQKEKGSRSLGLRLPVRWPAIGGWEVVTAWRGAGGLPA